MKPRFLNFTFMTVLVLGQSSGLFEARAVETPTAHVLGENNAGENKTNCESDASSGIESTAQFANNTAKVLWAQFTAPITINIIKKELEKPLKVCSKEIKPKAVVVDVPLEKPNPLHVTPKDFDVGMHLVLPPEIPGPVPTVTPGETVFFDEMVSEGNLPLIYVTGGHYVISEGYHNHTETAFMYEPTLLDTLDHYPNARKVFDGVRLAILLSCNTMTNLEPHGPNGEYLSPERIREALEKGGKKSRQEMLGTSGKTNSLEFYKSRLAREYGPNAPAPNRWEYTRRAADEKCLGPGKYDDCDITNLERIMPDEGIADGSHMYNVPARYKKIFPNAYLILGFSSASPREKERSIIFQKVLDETYKHLKPLGVTNIIGTIVAPQTDETLRKKVIEALRKNWTIQTYKMNRKRPSGSITPFYPDLDANGVFNVHVSKDTPLYAPYEDRGSKPPMAQK